MKFLELKEIQLSVDLSSLAESYPSTGLYLNTLNKEVFYVSKELNMCLYLDLYDNMNITSEPKVKDSEKSTFTEDFVLKLASITTKNEKFKEL